MNRDFVLAPMMGKTDSQFRYLVRQISKEIVLFTEMIHSNAILFGNKKIFEEFKRDFENKNIENPIINKIYKLIKDFEISPKIIFDLFGSFNRIWQS